MLELNMMNGKSMMVNPRHIQALITGGSGDGTQVILGGTLTYEVRQNLKEIKEMMVALEK